MPKSRMGRKKGRNKRWDVRFYRKPKAVIPCESEKLFASAQTGVKGGNIKPKDNVFPIRKAISGCEDGKYLDALQDVNLNEALLKCNATQLIVPVDGIEAYRATTRGWLEIDYFTAYQTINERLTKKLTKFGLGFVFPKTVESIDPVTGIKQIKVTMRIFHADGGTMTLQSKPVLIQSRVIDGQELSYDMCVTSATTMCKRYLLCSTVFNVLVNSPDCYCPNARQLTLQDMEYISKDRLELIKNSICENGSGFFWPYIRNKYNIKYCETLRNHQFETILYEALEFRLTNSQIKMYKRIKKAQERKMNKYYKVREVVS